MNKWISVNDRLPEDERKVIVYIGYTDQPKFGFISMICYFSHDPNPHWQYESILKEGQKVLYWMPMPDSPVEEKE